VTTDKTPESQPSPPAARGEENLRHSPLSSDTESRRASGSGDSSEFPKFPFLNRFVERAEHTPFGTVWPPEDPEVTPTWIADEEELLKGTAHLHKGDSPPAPSVAPLLAAASVLADPSSPPPKPFPPGDWTPGSPRSAAALEAVKEFARVRDGGILEQLEPMLDENVVVEAPMLNVKGRAAMMAALSRWSHDLEGTTEPEPAGEGWFARTIRVKMGMLHVTLVERCFADPVTGLISAISLSPLFTPASP